MSGTMAHKLRKILALGFSLAVAGCVESTEPIPDPNSHSNREGLPGSQRTATVSQRSHTGRLRAIHVETRVEVIPRKFVAGSPIDIVVSLRNTGHETAFVSRCPLAYAFFDESGAHVGPYFVCGDFPSYLELAPGQKFEKRMRQVGYWAPGKYTVYAYVEALPLQHPFAVRILPAD